MEKNGGEKKKFLGVDHNMFYKKKKNKITNHFSCIQYSLKTKIFLKYVMTIDTVMCYTFGAHCLTSRQPISELGEGGSRESSLSPIGLLGDIYDS